MVYSPLSFKIVIQKKSSKVSIANCYKGSGTPIACKIVYLIVLISTPLRKYTVLFVLHKKPL